MAVNINVPSQVRTFANLAAFPATGALKTIYIAEDTNKTYRWTGSVYVEVSASASGITIGSTAIASGVVGRVLFEGAGNVVQESSSLFWDATNNRLGIGTSTPTSDFAIIKNVGSLGSVFSTMQNTNSNGEAAMVLRNDLYYAGFELFGSTFGLGLSNTALFTTQSGITNLGFATLGAANISFRTNSTGSNNERLTIFGSSGNIGINTTTDSGFRLDVNGTARVSGNLTLNNTSGTNRSTDIRTSNSIDNFPTTTFYPSSGTNVGQSFQVIPRGTGFSAGIKAQFAISGTDTIADGTNFEAMVVRATGSAFTFSSGKGGTGTIRPMLFSAGFLDGVTNPNQLWLYSTGNVGINTTTDAGYRLDVNGTAVIRGITAITGNVTISNSSNLSVTNGVVGIDSNVAENNSYGSFNLGVNTTGGYSWIQSYNSRRIALNPLGNGVVVGSSTKQASAEFEVVSTSKGFLPPRMTTTQKNAIASPAAGLMVYDTTLNVISYYNGSMWI